MKSMLTLTAAVHPGRCSPLGACRRFAALSSPLWGTTELWAVGQRRLALTAVGTERSTAAQNIVALRFYRALTLSKVDPRKYAVRVGNSARLRSGRGVSRGAENVLRTEESTLEKQVSMRSWGQLFPTLQRFWCLGDNWAADFLSVVHMHKPAFTRSLHTDTHTHTPLLLTPPGAGPGCAAFTCLSFLVVILLAWSYATLGCCLVNIIFKYLLAEEQTGQFEAMLMSVCVYVCVLLFAASVTSPQNLLRFIQWLFLCGNVRGTCWSAQCILHIQNNVWFVLARNVV